MYFRFRRRYCYFRLSSAVFEIAVVCSLMCAVDKKQYFYVNAWEYFSPHAQHVRKNRSAIRGLTPLIISPPFNFTQSLRMKIIQNLFILLHSEVVKAWSRSRDQMCKFTTLIISALFKNREF